MLVKIWMQSFKNELEVHMLEYNRILDYLCISTKFQDHECDGLDCGYTDTQTNISINIDYRIYIDKS